MDTPTYAAPVVAPGKLSKYFLFGFIGLMALYVLRHNEAFLVNSADPSWPHYEPIKWYLLPHGLAGALALLLGPMQFSDRLRKRFTKFHRVAGRFYVVAVCVAAPMGLFIQWFEERLGARARSRWRRLSTPRCGSRRRWWRFYLFGRGRCSRTVSG